MILIAIFAVYAIATRRVRITRTFVITGENARLYGIVLLVLLLAARGQVGPVLREILPAQVLANPIARTLIDVAVFGILAVVTALFFRNKTSPETPSPPSDSQ